MIRVAGVDERTFNHSPPDARSRPLDNGASAQGLFSRALVGSACPTASAPWRFQDVRQLAGRMSPGANTTARPPLCCIHVASRCLSSRRPILGSKPDPHA